LRNVLRPAAALYPEDALMSISWANKALIWLCITLAIALVLMVYA
jgi:hypothetical protein